MLSFSYKAVRLLEQLLYLQAILWSAFVWDAMAPQTIRNCWHHTRILPVTWNADIADEDERRRERDPGRIAEFVDEINDLLVAMGMSDNDCNVEEFISPPVEESGECHHNVFPGHKCKRNSNIEPLYW